MAKSKRTGWRKWLNYTLNGLLVVVILIAVIPSWRLAFQAWFNSMTLSDMEFEQTGFVSIPENEKHWELVTPEGELFNFADFEGKPIVLSFWATWCGACRAEFPHLDDLTEHWEQDEIAFISVTEESMETVEASGLNETYDFLYCTQTFPAFFEVRVLPTLAIMDKNMNMVFRMEGAADIDNDENIAFLNSLLEQP